MKIKTLPLLGFTFVALFAVAFGLLRSLRQAPPSSPDRPLLLYCAAGLAGPVQRIVAEYERETGRRVDLQFGGSGTLLSALQVAKRGDLFLAADASYTQRARALGLADEILPVAVLTPVLAVKSGNPKNIHGLQDLLRDDVRVSLADPQAAAVGKTTQKMMEAQGRWTVLESAVRERGVVQPTVNGVVTDLSAGPMDAAIVWDSAIPADGRVDALPIPGAADFANRVSLTVLRSSARPSAALHFARYLSARDRGGPIFAAAGFPPVPGDEWVEVPEVTLFSGSVNRVSIDDAVRVFADREGVRVNTVYNGCGILVSQMRAGAKPDAYFACDTSYMDDVYERFRDHQLVSATEMVIITSPGNPGGVASLEDLAKPGVRVAICNPEYSALGGLTRALFTETGLLERILPNVTYGDAPTADTVVTRVRTGREDAGIVYLANTVGLGGALPVLKIDHPRATAAQPIAVAVDTRFPQIMDRLSAHLTGLDMKARYEEAGFVFKVGTEMPPR